MKLIKSSKMNNTLIISNNHIIIYPVSHFLTKKEIEIFDIYKDKFLIYFDHK